MPNWQRIAEHLRRHTGVSEALGAVSEMSGGGINTTHKLALGNVTYFVKTHHASMLGMFEAEHDGLLELQGAHCIRTPTPLLSGVVGSAAFLVMEFLNCGGSGNAQRLGENLAALHCHTWRENSRERFGWRRDNTIGSTPQINSPSDQWPLFWAQHRLGFQLNLAVRNGGHDLRDKGERLREALPAFFSGYHPAASLLHGDLWAGNHAFLPDGTPVIFDPAVYYGDRETDLAMTELFGGFSEHFYAAYRASYPLDPGYPVRKNLYNLYHILNHFNLFGSGYQAQASDMVDRLLSEL
ncbi:MAG: fructosamine kinase family protein [Gammaproteobacteria bacterium]|nr:fructosamine kinase family protein [Gammaproteobacteria bacterium]